MFADRRKSVVSKAKLLWSLDDEVDARYPDPSSVA